MTRETHERVNEGVTSRLVLKRQDSSALYIKFGPSAFFTDTRHLIFLRGKRKLKNKSMLNNGKLCRNCYIYKNLYYHHRRHHQITVLLLYGDLK